MRMPGFIRNIPTPVKVVGGVGLGYVAYRAATIPGGVQPGDFAPGPVAGVASGIGAAVLLGSAIGDMRGGGMYHNPFVETGTGDRVEVTSLRGAARYLDHLRSRLVSAGDYRTALTVEKARCSVAAGDTRALSQINAASQMLHEKGERDSSRDLDELRVLVARQMNV